MASVAGGRRFTVATRRAQWRQYLSLANQCIGTTIEASFRYSTAVVGRWSVESGDLKNLHGIRTAAVEILRSLGEPDSDFDACALALSELISNAMRHGPGGRIDVTLDWSDPRPILAVCDAGRGFALHIALPDGRSEGGRGLFLISKLVGAPLVLCDGNGCTVSVVLPVRRRT